MTLSSAIWRCIITLFFSFSIHRRPLLPVGCQRFNPLGKLTVEPAPLFLLGSNLTVYCHITVSCQLWYKISLRLNDEPVDRWERINCTTAVFHLPNVRTPQSTVICGLKTDQRSMTVNGLDLQGGLPPDKPGNISCETTRSSAFVDCSWRRGQETYISTTYNISVSRENGTQRHFFQIQDAEEITIPRGILNQNTKYQLIITVYNYFGSSQSDPFLLCVKDKVIPETPHIRYLEFGNSSAGAVLQWKTNEPLVHLRPYIRLRTHNGSWEVREGAELSEGLLKVDDLKPLTEYEFQMRTCNSTSGRTRASEPIFTSQSTSGKRWLCSRWSPSVMGMSPGKGPSQQLNVWRMFNSHGTNETRMVMVLWKPPPPEDYSGEVQQYKIFLASDVKQEMTCPAPSSSVQVPAEVRTLSVSAVTLYGSSPPAEVPLRHSGVHGPVLKELAPAANGSAVLVSWSCPGPKCWSTSGGELLHFVAEWTSVPATGLQWRTLAKSQSSTSITGLTAGVRYNISLYAVTTRGVSAPSSGLIYCKEQKPLSGPKMWVLAHEVGRILIAWDELPLDQRRGFITNYTLYVQTLDSTNMTRRVTMPGSGPRQKWLDCPEGALALQLSASTSAGEGPRGSRISSQPAAPAAGLVVMIVFIIALFIAIIANLMCWSCVRKRVKQKCISWGPAWLVENLPKPGNSNAIRLLKQDGSEPSLLSTHSDPPLSPISLISWEERDDVYPNIHLEESQTGAGRPTAETPLLASDSVMMLARRQLEHVSYKPQIALLASQGEDVRETEEEEDVTASEEEDMCSSVFGELLGGLMSSVEVGFSDSPQGPALSSVGGLLWHKTPETTSILNRSLLVGRKGSDSEVQVDSPSLELQQGDIRTHTLADTCLSQYSVETTLTGGYFPQVAAASSTTLCETQR